MSGVRSVNKNNKTAFKVRADVFWGPSVVLSFEWPWKDITCPSTQVTREKKISLPGPSPIGQEKGKEFFQGRIPARPLPLNYITRLRSRPMSHPEDYPVSKTLVNYPSLGHINWHSSPAIWSRFPLFFSVCDHVRVLLKESRNRFSLIFYCRCCNIILKKIPFLFLIAIRQNSNGYGSTGYNGTLGPYRMASADGNDPDDEMGSFTDYGSIIGSFPPSPAGSFRSAIDAPGFSRFLFERKDIKLKLFHCPFLFFYCRSRAGTGTSFATVASFGSYRSRVSNTASFHTCVEEEFSWDMTIF